MYYFSYLCVIAFPFLLAGMIRAVVELKEPQGSGPIPWCIGLAFVLLVIYYTIQNTMPTVMMPMY